MAEGGAGGGRRPAPRARAAAWAWRARLATAAWRPLPDVVIIGAQRSGTTSLFDWLAGHPGVAPASTKEVHYFDRFYANGPRWYRGHFALRLPGGRARLGLEATPIMLFHPLAPARAAADLPPTTRFVVLLREPAQRAVSQYWHSRRRGAEDQPLERALALEDERLAGQEAVVAGGGESFAFRNFSYKARGRYAEQLRRWFTAVGRDRVLVMESERLFHGGDGPPAVLAWLGLAPLDTAFPATNDAPRAVPEDPEVIEELRRYFAPCDDDLADLLGTRFWTP
ncbi:MAG TPA: sulfotransferase domain-containing protein [Acidimicrobiales bacterium]|nr:sulfotransferase domain-containing protein [Acidimicrobiales bacterium]